MGSFGSLAGQNNTKKRGSPTRDPLAEMMLGVDFAPNLLASSARTTPEQIRQSQAALQQALWGTPAGNGLPPGPEQMATKARYEHYLSPHRTEPGAEATAESWTRGGSAAGGPTAATPGLVEQFMALINPSNAANTATRTATMQDIRGLNPSNTALFDELSQSATLGLKAGSTLDPQERYAAMGASRDAATRGFIPGSQAQDLEQALAFFGGGQNLLQRRQATAGNVAELGNRLYTLPTLEYSSATSPGQFLAAGSAASVTEDPMDAILNYFGNAFAGNQAAQNDFRNRMTREQINTSQLASQDFQTGMGGFSKGGAFSG